MKTMNMKPAAVKQGADMTRVVGVTDMKGMTDMSGVMGMKGVKGMTHMSGVMGMRGMRGMTRVTGMVRQGITARSRRSGDFVLRVGAAALLAALAACGGAEGPNGEKGPVIGTRPQTIAFGTLPKLAPNDTATLTATATSGLKVRYSSLTPGVCTVEAETGKVTALAAGNCTLSVSQEGNTVWAAATQQQRLAVASDAKFEDVTDLAVGDALMLKVGATAGQKVTYGSDTPTICSVDASSGLLTALQAGTCTVTADVDTPDAGSAAGGQGHEGHEGHEGHTGHAVRAGAAAVQPRAVRKAVSRVTQQYTIAAAGAVTAPSAPESVSARLGTATGTVQVQAKRVRGGGSAITRYAVTSTPAGITAEGNTLPVTVQCPQGSCAGYSFTLAASNASGDGAASAAAEVISRYAVVVKFKEPDYAHDMTEFHGHFHYNLTQMTVSGLQGDLSEVMAGNNQPNQPWPDGMPLVPLRHQLSSIKSAGGEGLLVTSFRNENTNTLSNDPRDAGTDGWSPGKGGWKYWGYAHGDRKAANPGNAYIRIFVNTKDPLTPLTQAQVDQLAYADCAPEGMMGDDCMTGTSVAVHGTRGSMRGYPLSQTVTREEE